MAKAAWAMLATALTLEEAGSAKNRCAHGAVKSSACTHHYSINTRFRLSCGCFIRHRRRLTTVALDHRVALTSLVSAFVDDIRVHIPVHMYSGWQQRT
jgi:hypothetical protein